MEVPLYMLYYNTYIFVCQAFMTESDLQQTTIIRFTNCYGPLFEVTLAGVILVPFEPAWTCKRTST